MHSEFPVNQLRFPDPWPEQIRAALLHVASFAQAAIVYTRGWCADSSLARVRLAGQLEQARNEISLLREEIRITTPRWSVDWRSCEI